MKVTIGDKTYTIAFEHAPRRTLCRISEPATAFACIGDSKLHPNDNYCKETGRKVSLKRALANAGFTRQERKLFWAAYRYRAAPFAPEPTSSPRRLETPSEAPEGGAVPWADRGEHCRSSHE